MEKIKQLREMTGAGMVDCKKALEEAGGDMEKAVEILRKKGIAKAAKREDRNTSEGIIKVSVNADKTKGYIAEFNAETDFVVRNDKFQKFTSDAMALIEKNHPQTLDELFALPMESGTVKETLDVLSGTIGEKMDIKRFAIMESRGAVCAYSHMGGRIGVLVSFSDKADEELMKNIAMQIAAANPKYLCPEDVPQAEIDKEKEIYREQLLKEGKPENMLEKIMVGKVGKYHEDVCLLKQEYILEDKKKVEDVLNGASIEQFVRYSL